MPKVSFYIVTPKAAQERGGIVKIGPFKGKSTVWLGKGPKAGRNVNRLSKKSSREVADSNRGQL